MTHNKFDVLETNPELDESEMEESERDVELLEAIFEDAEIKKEELYENLTADGWSKEEIGFYLEHRELQDTMMDREEEEAHFFLLEPIREVIYRKICATLKEYEKSVPQDADTKVLIAIREILRKNGRPAN